MNLLSRLKQPQFVRAFGNQRLSSVLIADTPLNITGRESFYDALGDYSGKFPTVKEVGTLKPTANISKDARQSIASLISARLAFADSIVSTRSEKSRALIVYTILGEILRFGYGDLVKHQAARGLTDPVLQLAILHEEETEGKEMEEQLPRNLEYGDDEVQGELHINYGETIYGDVFSGETDFIIYESCKSNELDNGRIMSDEEYAHERKIIRFVVALKDDLSSVSNLEEGHYKLMGQLTSTINLNKEDLSVWGALTDGYLWYFYKISKLKPSSNRSDEKYIIEKSPRTVLFDQGMLHGEKQVEALNYFFSSLYPNVKSIISKENIQKADILCSQKIESKKNHFELSFHTLEELNDKISKLETKLDWLQTKNKK